MSDENKLSAVLEMKDNFTAVINKAKDGIKSLGDAAKNSERGIDKAREGIDKFKSSADGVKRQYDTSLRLKDRASDIIQKVKTDLTGISGKVYTATVNIRQVGADKLKGMGNNIMNSSVGMGLQMATAGGIGFGMLDAVNNFKSFEQQMRAVQAISGATTEDFNKLSAAALESGKSTKFTATESGKALEYMAMAGWKTDEMIAALPGVMDLAASSGEDLAMVSDVVTDSMTSFYMSAAQSAQFADVLAAASSNSNTNVGKMGFTFKYVAPLAGSLGYSIQDTAIAIGAMADAGIKGEMAGTSLRSLLSNLAAPTGSAQKAMTDLGISLTDATGKMKPLRTLMGDLREAFKGLTQEQKAQYASMLAGQDGMSGLLAIVDKDEGAFKKLTDAIDNSQGSAKKMANTRLDGLSGDITKLSSTWENFTINIMSGKGSDGLRGFVQEATKLVDNFNKSIEKNGLGVKSIFDLIKEAVGDLTKKFLAFDGIGSVLAGGALIGALYKIYSAGKKIKDLFKGGKGGKGVGDESVGTMNVTAGIVNVNGKGGIPDTPVPGGGGKGGGKVPAGAGKGAGALGFLGRNAGKIGLGAALLYGAYDVATSDDKGRAVSRNVGGIAGGIAGAKMGAAAGGAIGAAFGGVGAAPGALIGGAIGSIAGYMGGSELGDEFGKHLDDMKNAVNSFVDETQTTLSGWADNITSVVGPAVDGIKNGFIDGINFTVGLAATAWDEVEPYWSAFADWTSANVFQPIGQFASDAWNTMSGVASNAWNTVTTAASNAWGMITAAWAPLSSWFDSNIWGPVKGAASAAGGAVASAFNSAIGTIEGAWQGLSSWFDSNVWGPLKNKINSAGAWIDGIEARGEQITGLKHNALGSSYYTGGLTEINERGGEIIDLPNGSRIYPHTTTVNMLQNEMSNYQPQTVPVMGAPTVNVSGNTFVVREEADIDKIAYKIAQLFNNTRINYGGGY